MPRRRTSHSLRKKATAIRTGRIGRVTVLGFYPQRGLLVYLGGTADIFRPKVYLGRFCFFAELPSQETIIHERTDCTMMKRTVYCGLLREEHIGTSQICCGWVQNKRDMGGVIFIDLHDREGILQVVCDARNLSPDDFRLSEDLRTQSVIAVKGEIRHRSEDTYNPKIATGTVELSASAIELISQADPLPYSLDESLQVREDLRLKYRYLDLRRQKMTDNLRFRHKVQKSAQDYLDSQGFICVETPMLGKSTPEGAREYLVPSRVHPGAFYALPQSPQIYKQLLMVGGLDKYYQVARCFRDEDLRADRQPEFTQVDMEMSFVDQEDVLVHLERLFKHIMADVKGMSITSAFPRITWTEAMDRYGSDKPDIRFGLPIVDISDIASSCSFSVFRNAVDAGGVCRAINACGCAGFTRTQIEQLTEKAVSYGAKGMAWIVYREDGELYSILSKFLTEDDMRSIVDAVDAKPGDFILFCADKLSTVRRVLGNLRLDLADMLELRKKDDYKFLIVTDFPQFEYSEEEKRYVATHHPFTMPYEEDVQYLFTAPERVRAQAYDVVLNGIELGSGSVRIHDRNIQKLMFEALGFSDEDIEKRFGFMVNAFRYGTPPHAGFAFGLDRLVMLLLGADSLRDVIAFPKIKDASCLMTQAPTPVDASQLEILGLDKMFASAAGSESGREFEKISVDVEKIAELARLSLTNEEKTGFETDMRSIIGFANDLLSVDTSGVSAREHISELKNVMREDVVKHEISREELLDAAKTKHDGYITVPRVIEK